MYFLRIAPLKAQLARQGLREPERFAYLFALLIVTRLALLGLPTIGLGEAALLAIVAAAGVSWAYVRNGGPNGSAFLDRYFSLAWVVYLRVALVVAAVGLVVTLAGQLPRLASLLSSTGNWLDMLESQIGAARELDEESPSSGHFGLRLLLGAYVFWSVGRHIGHVRRIGGDGAPVPSSAGDGRALDRFVERVSRQETSLVGAGSVRPLRIRGGAIRLLRRRSRPARRTGRRR